MLFFFIIHLFGGHLRFPIKITCSTLDRSRSRDLFCPCSEFSSNSLMCVCQTKHQSHTNQWLSSPVILVIKDISVSVKEVREEFPQIVVVWLLEEVKPTHVSQVGGHLFCCIHRFIHRDTQGLINIC